MADDTIGVDALRRLSSPIRNRYFYGKLLDDRHLSMEQCYEIEKRWLLNRLTLGPGVLCGLRVVAGTGGTVVVSPGVAVDGLGREIVVPAAVVVDPAQPTDPRGVPTGDRLTGGGTTLTLCYTECPAEPIRVLAGDCDTAPAMAAGAVVERYRIVVTAGRPPAIPTLTADQAAAIFPTDPAAGFDRLAAAEQALAGDPFDPGAPADPGDPPTGPCAPPAEPCVVLATVTLADGEQPLTVEEFAARPQVFSNTVLFELIAALAARVDACCAGGGPAPTPTSLAVLDGDQQSGPPGDPLPAPIRAQASGVGGQPVAGAGVTFAVEPVDAAVGTAGAIALAAPPGGGGPAWADSVDATTDRQGIAAVGWRLGTLVAGVASGTQQVRATLTADPGTAVTFTATAQATAPPAPPVVRELLPANGVDAGTDWLHDWRLRLAFDQPIDQGQLAEPDPWLRAFVLFGGAEGARRILRVQLHPVDPPTADGTTAWYQVSADAAFAGASVLVLIRSAGAAVVGAATHLDLDADYPGTRLTSAQLQRLWETTAGVADPKVVAALVATGRQPPSGDGTPGGFWHSFFTISPAG